jgi:hypothetical protein
MTLIPGYGFPPADYGRMLASTADRERALDVLRAGFAEGRLTKEEHEERMSHVHAARTYADLAAVTWDLPGGQPPVPAYPPAAVLYPPVVPHYPPIHPQYPLNGPAYPPADPEKANSLAVVSLWCGVAGVIFFGLPSIAALVLSSVAFRQIRRTGERGSGLAAAGLLLGVLGFLLFVVQVVNGQPGF